MSCRCLCIDRITLSIRSISQLIVTHAGPPCAQAVNDTHTRSFKTNTSENCLSYDTRVPGILLPSDCEVSFLLLGRAEVVEKAESRVREKMVSTSLFTFLPEAYQEDVSNAFCGALMLSTGTLVLTVILELASLPTVRSILKTAEGKSLYVSAVFLNFLNHYVYGIPVYMAAVLFFCRHEKDFGYQLFALRALGVILVHALSYYHVHKSFHTFPGLYKYHRYHHRFNTHVPPVSANAVSGVEYLLAYVVPFALAAFLVKPNVPEFQLAIGVISFCNLLIHTPSLEELSKRLWPVFSSTHRHIEHHKRLNVNYAAPTLNIDWFVKQINDFFDKSQG